MAYELHCCMMQHVVAILKRLLLLNEVCVSHALQCVTDLLTSLLSHRCDHSAAVSY